MYNGFKITSCNDNNGFEVILTTEELSITNHESKTEIFSISSISKAEIFDDTKAYNIDQLIFNDLNKKRKWEAFVLGVITVICFKIGFNHPNLYNFNGDVIDSIFFYIIFIISALGCIRLSYWVKIKEPRLESYFRIWFKNSTTKEYKFFKVNFNSKPWEDVIHEIDKLISV